MLVAPSGPDRRDSIHVEGLGDGIDLVGHGPAFRDTCNRIGGALGLPPVKTSKARGPEKDLPSCAHWPFNVRPEGY